MTQQLNAINAVQKIKIFKGIESKIDQLESDINDWLEHSGAKVIQIIGNIAPQSTPSERGGDYLSKSPYAPSDVLIIILYKTND